MNHDGIKDLGDSAPLPAVNERGRGIFSRTLACTTWRAKEIKNDLMAWHLVQCLEFAPGGETTLGFKIHACILRTDRCVIQREQ